VGTADVSVREAVLEDRKALWHWYMDPVHRVAFPRTNTIPYETHILWYNTFKDAPGRILYVAISDNLRVGAVRFDLRQAQQYEILLTIKTAYAGSGLASTLLTKSIERLKATRPVQSITAELPTYNTVLSDIFSGAGFICTEQRPTGKRMTLTLDHTTLTTQNNPTFHKR
jgi:Acetyltransferase (GNAT) family